MDAEKGRVRKRGKHEDLAVEYFSQRFPIILAIKTCFNNTAGTERVRERKAAERHAETADKKKLRKVKKARARSVKYYKQIKPDR